MAVTIKKKEGKSGKGMVTKEYPDGTVEETSGDLLVSKSDQPMAQVTFSMGHTKNLGNYESVKINVAVTLPSNTDELDTAFEFAQEWVDDKLTKVLEEVEDSLK